jgi:hypothetical protein
MSQLLCLFVTPNLCPLVVQDFTFLALPLLGALSLALRFYPEFAASTDALLGRPLFLISLTGGARDFLSPPLFFGSTLTYVAA